MSVRPIQHAIEQRRASVAPWLGVLLVMMLSLNTLGGWVRLSGSGIAIPQWPLIHGSLLPPSDAAGWKAVRQDWEQHQADLRRKVARGELNEGNLGREPVDSADFRLMFLTEYGHRLLAALTAVVLAGCLTVIMRDAAMRRRVGVPMTVCALLVVGQAILGGALVDQGTNTHYLFLHQGDAALILACALWSLLRLLDDSRPAMGGLQRASPWLRHSLTGALAAAWFQLILGALVAGSKFSAPAYGLSSVMARPLWASGQSLSWNLLDNAGLHQWTHRSFAWVVVLLLLGSYWQAGRSQVGPRLRLALQVSATFIIVQIVLGLASLLVASQAGGATLPLAHQLMGMCLFVAIALAWYDARHEPTEAIDTTRAGPTVNSTAVTSRMVDAIPPGGAA